MDFINNTGRYGGERGVGEEDRRRSGRKGTGKEGEEGGGRGEGGGGQEEGERGRGIGSISVKL